MKHLSLAEIIAKYPSPSDEAIRGEISEIVRRDRFRIVVLDDDPTGIQTVQDNYLLTNWKPENIVRALTDAVPFFYILTNTRAMTASDAEKTVHRAVDAVLDANRALGYRLVFVSRSDSTLRGHFPLEPEAMRREISERGIPVSLPVVFAPAFFEAGRYTIGGVQTMREGDALIPVSETEFARDNVFGYTRADLSGYIREKSNGTVAPYEIRHFGLDELREASVETLEERIAGSAGKKYVTLDALDYTDLRKFALAWLKAAARNEGYTILRTSSSMPKALSGIADRPLLDRAALVAGDGGGLFVIGSHVRKTTVQLEKLLEIPQVRGVELNIRDILASPGELLDKTENTLEEIHRSGSIPAVYTSRQELRFEDAAERQQIGQRISAFLVDIVRNLQFCPSWLVAKGGITSHDILTDGLGVERARVLGQVLPGVPAVAAGSDDRFPGMAYVIFPGNVGSDEALKEICLRLRGNTDGTDR